MEKIAQASSCILYSEEEKIFVIKTRSASFAVLIFVLLILCVIFSINGILWIVLSLAGKTETIATGFFLLIAGILSGLLCYQAAKQRKKLNSVLPSHSNLVCILDTKNKIVLDVKEKPIARFDEVLLKKKFRVTSSSKKLVLAFRAGEIEIVKGNLFDGGLGNIESILNEKGLH